MSTDVAVPSSPTVSDEGARSSRMLTLLPLLIVGATFLVVVRRTVVAVTNTDTYFHLRLGSEFLGPWSLTDPGSVSDYATADWVPSQWLGQMGMAASEGVAGLPGVTFLTALVTLAMTATFFLTARSNGPLIATAAIVPLAIVACAPSLSGRPQVISYLLAALVTSAWLRAARDGRLPWWIIPATWVWSMVHGMWSVSVIISAVAVAGLWWRSHTTDDTEHDARFDRRALLIPALSAIVVMLTPVGVDVYAAVLRVGSITEYFAEWGPTDYSRPNALIAAALFAAALLLMLRRRERVDTVTLLLVLLAGAWIAYSVRTVPVGVAMLVPLLAARIAEILPARPRQRSEGWVIGGSLALAVLLAALLAPSTANDMRQDSPAHASVASLPQGEGLLNEWNEGGYDMWRHQHLNIVSHGYGDMFTDEELERNVQIADRDPEWEASLGELDLSHALLYWDSPLRHELESHLGWVVVAEDPEVAEDDLTGTVADLRMVHLQSPEGQ